MRRKSRNTMLLLYKVHVGIDLKEFIDRPTDMDFFGADADTDIKGVGQADT